MNKWLLPLSLLAGFVQSETLTVYTYDSFTSEWGPGPQLEQAFEQQCDCDLTFVAAEDGVAILNRLKIEGRNTKADVILGIDAPLMESAVEQHLVQQHSLPSDGLKADLHWQNTYFLPFDYGYFAFIYNRDQIKQPAQSMAELLASKATVIYQDPRTSTPGQGLLLWINSLYPDNAEQAWEQLNSHTVTVTKGWSEAYNMFLEGSADYVLSYTTSPAYHMVAENENRYQAAEFNEGHIAQIEVAGISQYAHQPELARQFLTFLTSKTAQEIIPVTNWMLPVIDDVSLPEAFSTLVQPKAIAIDYPQFTQQREQWIKTWRSIAAQ
ncbi:thiamine ABC transporter substrate binding subunit [Gynuella sp.]|uniref:thiamine ABC transporter substrate binding subunit n=1 Tax=Gynuella sp. TaxID=2969146 RepID=UPI003D0FB19E